MMGAIAGGIAGGIILIVVIVVIVCCCCKKDNGRNPVTDVMMNEIDSDWSEDHNNDLAPQTMNTHTHVHRHETYDEWGGVHVEERVTNTPVVRVNNGLNFNPDLYD